jgi:mannose-6-phosphate isomerase-like protein (cupin superfamily)
LSISIDEARSAMPVITSPDAATHDLGGTRFTSLVTPSRGCQETAVWQVEIDPTTPATPHRVSREEVFVVVDGFAHVRIGDDHGVAASGDAILVPAGVEFTVENRGSTVLRMVCSLPVGGQACMDGEHYFTPPWAE